MEKTHTIYKLLKSLEEATLPHFITYYDSEYITIIVHVLEQIIELDIFEDGHIEVQEYTESISILDCNEAVFDFIDKFKDKDDTDNLPI